MKTPSPWSWITILAMLVIGLLMAAGCRTGQSNSPQVAITLREVNLPTLQCETGTPAQPATIRLNPAANTTVNLLSVAVTVYDGDGTDAREILQGKTVEAANPAIRDNAAAVQGTGDATAARSAGDTLPGE